MGENDGMYFFDDGCMSKTNEVLTKQICEALHDAAYRNTFKGITEEMVETQNRKNADYGNSFHDTMNEFGPVSAAIRLNDKLNRYKQLIKTDTVCVKEETIEDTLLDLANYAVMTVEWYRKRHGKGKC